MRRLSWVLLLAAAAITVAVGLFLVSSGGQRLLIGLVVRSLRDAFVVPVTVEKATVDPLRLSLVLEGVTVGPAISPKAYVGSARVAVDPWRSLGVGAVVCDVWLSGLKLDLRQGERLLKAAAPRRVLVAPGRVKVRLSRARFRSVDGKRRLELLSGTVEIKGDGALRARVGEGLVVSGGWSAPIGAKISGRLEAGLLDIMQARLRLPGARVAIAGTVGLREQTINAHTRARVDVEGASWLASLLPGETRGQVRLRGRLEGRLEDPSFDGWGALRDVAIGRARVELAKFSVGARRAGIGLRIETVKAGSITGRASVWIPGAVSQLWRAHGTWRGLQVSSGQGLGQLLPVEISGGFQASGRLLTRAVRIRGRTTVKTLRDGASRRLPFRFKGRWDANGHGGVRLALAGSQREGIKGALDLAEEAGRGGRIDLGISDMELVGRFAGLDLGGDLRLRGRLSGSSSHPVARARVSSGRLRIGGVPLTRLVGSLVLDSNRLRSSGVKAELAGGKVAAGGIIAFNKGGDNDLWLTVERVPVTVAMAGLVKGYKRVAEGSRLEGAVTGQAAVKGRWRKLQFAADGNIVGVRWAGEKVGELAFSFTGTPDNWGGEAHLADGDFGQLRVSLTGAKGGLEGTVSGRGLELEKIGWLVNRLPSVAGQVEISGAVGGTVAAPTLHLQLESGELALDREQRGRSRMVIDGSRNQWRIRTELLNGRVTGSVAALPEGVEASLRWRDLNLAFLREEWEGLKAFSGGELSVGGRGWDLASLSGEFQLAEIGVLRDGELQLRVSEIHGSLNRGWISVGEIQVESDGESIRVAGKLNLEDGEIDGLASGVINLVVLELVPGVVSSAGTITVDGKARRDAAGNWHLSGDVGVTGGAADLGLPIAVSDLTAAISLHDSVIEIAQAKAVVGGGELVVEGAVDLIAGVNVEWTVEGVSPAFPQWLESRIDGRGTISGGAELGSLLVSGDIELLEALYDRNLEVTDLVSAMSGSGSGSGSARDGRLADVALDLHLTAHDGIYIDNNLANIELAADLELLGTIGAPLVLGKIETIGGEVYLGGHTFTVSSAVLTLRDRESLNPELDVFAETDVGSGDESQHVWVQVSGTLEENRVTFGADDPSLSQNDILGLLAFGATSSKLAKGEASIPLSQLLSWAPVGGGFEEDVVQALPVDRLEVNSSLSRTTGKLEPRLTATKALGKQLSAKVSTTLGSERRQEFFLEYRVTPEVLLEGSWQSATKTRSGAFGADVKFRHRFMDFPRIGRGH